MAVRSVTGDFLQPLCRVRQTQVTRHTLRLNIERTFLSAHEELECVIPPLGDVTRGLAGPIHLAGAFPRYPGTRIRIPMFVSVHLIEFDAAAAQVFLSVGVRACDEKIFLCQNCSPLRHFPLGNVFLNYSSGPFLSRRYLNAILKTKSLQNDNDMSVKFSLPLLTPTWHYREKSYFFSNTYF